MKLAALLVLAGTALALPAPAPDPVPEPLLKLPRDNSAARFTKWEFRKCDGGKGFECGDGQCVPAPKIGAKKQSRHWKCGTTNFFRSEDKLARIYVNGEPMCFAMDYGDHIDCPYSRDAEIRKEEEFSKYLRDQ